MIQKYEFTGKCMEVSFFNKFENKTKKETVYQIRSLIDNDNFPVKAGDIGGWVSSESNLSQKGSCWVSPNSVVVEQAIVQDNAFLYGESILSGNSIVGGRAEVTESVISGDSIVTGNAEVEMSTVQGASAIHGETKIVSSYLQNVETKPETNCSFSNSTLKSDEAITFHSKTTILSTHVSFEKESEFEGEVHLEGVSGSFVKVVTHAPLVMHNVSVEESRIHLFQDKDNEGSTISGDSYEKSARFKQISLELSTTHIHGNILLEGLSSSQTILNLSDCRIRDFSTIKIVSSHKSETHLMGCHLSGISVLTINGTPRRIIRDIILKNDEATEI